MPDRIRPRLLTCAAFWLLCAGAPSALLASAELAGEAAASRATVALERGAFSEAISEYESLAAQGFASSSLAVNRAIAYLGRAESSQAKPGDLGQALAALSEALLFDDDDEEASTAVESIRHEISRRRARKGADPVVVSPSLTRALAGLVDENVWAGGAALGSLLLSAGIAMRLWMQRAGATISAALLGCSGFGLLVLCAAMAGVAQHFRETRTPAVVIVEEARLLDDQGLPANQATSKLDYPSVPEGAALDIVQRRGTLAKVAWGSNIAWLPASALRPITGVPAR